MTETQAKFEGFIKGFNKADFESNVKCLLGSLQNAVENVTTLTVTTDHPKGFMSTSIALDGDINSTISSEDDQFLEYHHKLVTEAMRNRMEVVRLLVAVLGIGKLAALL